jgi:hypothetical protein
MQKSRLWAGAFLDSYLIIAGWRELIRQLDLVSFDRFRWFWDLTCGFWAENAKNKNRQMIKAIKSVASPANSLPADGGA